jgi:hypothetical protein
VNSHWGGGRRTHAISCGSWRARLVKLVSVSLSLLSVPKALWTSLKNVKHVVGVLHEDREMVLDWPKSG